MKITFWGTRGSIATPGPGTVRYGGNTSCVQLVTEQGTLIVFDCGTGARLLGDHLMDTQPDQIHGHMFLTHTHWDHIQGFPFFAPIFASTNDWRIYGPADGEHQLEQALSGQMQYTYFPVELNQISADLSCVDLDEGEFELQDAHVRSQYLNHPAVTLGYRVEVGGASFVYCTDHEPFSPVLLRPDTPEPTIDAMIHPGDQLHAQFLTDADLVVHDAQYTTPEYEAKRNWGHSSVDYVVEMALAAGVKQLALFHHDPGHDDRYLDDLQTHAQDIVARYNGLLEVFCAREGQTITLREQPEIKKGWGEAHLPTPASTRPTVMIADDEALIRDLVKDILSVENYVVVMAADGEEVLSKVGEQALDLLLLDMRLTGMDGFEVLTRLRATYSGRELPIIMLTGLTDAEFIERGFRLGATDYMTKPFSPPQLRARVSGWLRRAAHDGIVTG